MEATAKMKNGGECDLLARLAAEPAFGLNEAEMNELLAPEKYVGRCPEQVDALVSKVRPMLDGIERTEAQINL